MAGSYLECCLPAVDTSATGDWQDFGTSRWRLRDHASSLLGRLKVDWCRRHASRQGRRPDSFTQRAAIAALLKIRRGLRCCADTGPVTAPVASGSERLPGGACTHWKAPPFHGAHPKRSFAAN
jgi:hypothetical protein